jgi:hypothetical protein
MRYKTIDQIMAAGPCANYTRARVKRLFAGRSRISSHAVAKLDIPAPDRVWALLVYMTPQERYSFACDCAERVLLLERKYGLAPDKLSWRTIESSDWPATWSADAVARVAADRVAKYAEANALATGDVVIVTTAAARARERDWQIAHALEMMDNAGGKA